MSTYEFIVKNRVKPVSKAKTTHADNRPMTNDRLMVQRFSEQSQGFQSGPPEVPKLVFPVSPEKEGNLSGNTIPKRFDELDSLNSIEFQKSQRLEGSSKEAIIKTRHRRSGAELRSPR